jgi:hypothetical protein
VYSPPSLRPGRKLAGRLGVGSSRVGRLAGMCEAAVSGLWCRGAHVPAAVRGLSVERRALDRDTAGTRTCGRGRTRISNLEPAQSGGGGHHAHSTRAALKARPFNCSHKKAAGILCPTPYIRGNSGSLRIAESAHANLEF